MHKHNEVILQDVTVALVTEGGLSYNAGHLTQKFLRILRAKALADEGKAIGVKIDYRVFGEFIGANKLLGIALELNVSVTSKVGIPIYYPVVGLLIIDKQAHDKKHKHNDTEADGDKVKLAVV